ncbi:putative teichuronic acid biosynthesis glycosyltransferase TuaC [Nymphon striatum]|nr:putative teichuronic acid biosynthesis glycosyltransferase TuaC [Nymphon striatum]
MASRLSELLKLYASSPSTLVRHAGKSVQLLKSGKFSQLSDIASFWVTGSARTRIEGATDFNTEHLYKTLETNAKKNAATIVKHLSVHCPELMEKKSSNLVRLAERIQQHLIGKYQLIDEGFYRRLYLGESKLIPPIEHYMQAGRYKGNLPNFFINPAQYLNANPDVLALGIDPLLHFALFGWKEDRKEGVFFDSAYYLEANPDVAEANLSPFVHFIGFGQKEGRSPTRTASSISNVVAASSDMISQLQAQKLEKTGTIIVVSHDTELGGAQQVARVFAKWLLSATGYKVKFVTMRGGAFTHEFEEIAPTFNMQANKKTEVAANLREFAGEDIKAVFINSIASAGILEHWDTSLAPAIAFIHELPKVLEMYRSNVDLISDKATTIVSGSEAVRTALRDEFKIDKSKLERVYGFIEDMGSAEPKNFDDKAAAKAGLELNPNKALITACGVIHWRKSPEVFVEVAAKTLKENPNSAQFVWIGGGPDQEDCEKLVKERGLEADVIFTGYEPNIMRWLKASDVFLLPSQEDPFPLNGSGEAVAFNDAEAMAQSLLKYLADDELRQAHGLKGRALVNENYTVNTTGPQLMHYIRQAANLKPAVSVIVPNYNYEKYLPERLDTIFNQTFQDFDLILLDDCSKDNSVELMQAYADRRPGTKMLVNTDNSGSPFKQWMKGMDEAESDIIWVAEADDTAEPDLLETLLPSFDNSNVFPRIYPGRWSQPYLVTDHEEANAGLGIANCIPNASSVIFRRFVPEQEFFDNVTSMKLCGDWLFYLRAYARWNGCLLKLNRLITIDVTLNSDAIEKITGFTTSDLDRFGIDDEEQRKSVLETATRDADNKKVPTVLYVVSDISPGGGQVFSITLANNWMRHNGRSLLLNAMQFPEHPKVKSTIDPRVAFFDADHPNATLPELVKRFDIDIVHTSLWWSEALIDNQIDDVPQLPWITSMHGCHETHLENSNIDGTFPDRMQRMIGRVDQWVHTADKNKRVFETFGEPPRQVRLPNGMQIDDVEPYTREELGLRKDSIVLCLATRAIKEKGWMEAVAAVNKLNKSGQKVDLMLIGEGPAADALRKKKLKHIHLYGHVADLQRYLGAAQVGILPSYFVGESMPLVLLEMMGMGKPIISTNVGEISSIIGKGKTASGICIELENGKVKTDAIVECCYANDQY